MERHFLRDSCEQNMKRYSRIFVTLTGVHESLQLFRVWSKWSWKANYLLVVCGMSGTIHVKLRENGSG